MNESKLDKDDAIPENRQQIPCISLQVAKNPRAVSNINMIGISAVVNRLDDSTRGDGAPRSENMVSSNKIHNIGIASQIGKYSDAVEAPSAGRILFLSGTPGLAKDGHLPATFEGQAEQAWINVLALLEQARMGPQDLVKISQYLIRSEDILRYGPIRKKWLGDYQPASMLTVIPSLVRPDFLIEIEAYAVAP